MIAQSSFSPEEWDIILQAPAFAAVYIVQSDRYSRIVTYRKMVAAIKAILEADAPGAGSELIAAVRAAILAGQRPRDPDVIATDLAAARRVMLDGCRRAADLLAQRAPDAEADAYITWLLAIGEAVAAAPDEPMPPGHSVELAGECARAALETLARTLAPLEGSY